jgi:hypothetical protein
MPAEETQDDKWLHLAREAYIASTTYFDSYIRKRIDASIRQFQGKHPSGSKYYSDAYKARSKIFRNKTRGAIERGVAKAAGAFFATLDTVSVTPTDDNDPIQRASAEINKELLQHRLTKSIPWFQMLCGGFHDAQITGMVCSQQEWLYDKKRGIDKPSIEIFPIENLRLSKSAKWHDPVGTSPYVIRMLPMYIKDVKARMERVDEKTGEPKWIKLSDKEIQAAYRSGSDDTIRMTRDGTDDPKRNDTGITDFDVVWVHLNFIDIDGDDWVFYTLGTTHRLSTPIPIKEYVWHGKRPIVVGNCNVEPHRVYQETVPEITSQAQTEINEICNLRMDNVRFVLNKRYFVRRGRHVDLRSLSRNVPGSSTLMNNPEEDVKVVETHDVTRSAYEEQDRLNLEFDELVGAFSPTSVQSNRRMNETVGGMDILSNDADQVSEFKLRVFVETWVEPVLRQLIMLEQQYETDVTVLAIAGRRAQLYQRHGILAITDQLLAQELTLEVNVGIGATNPQAQVEKFLYGMKSVKEILGDTVETNLNFEEVVKEVFGKLGYRDGKRFLLDKGDQRVAHLLSKIEELQDLVERRKPAPEEVQARIEKLKAETQTINAETLQTGVETRYSAMQAGAVVATQPEIAPVADEILVGAGFTPPDNPNFISTLANFGEGVQEGSLPQDLPGGDVMGALPAPRENTSPIFPPVPQEPESPLQGIETQELDR